VGLRRPRESRSSKSTTTAISKQKPIKTIDIEIAVAKYFDPRKNIIVPNISWGLGLHECDLLIIRPKTGYALEVEIKISKSDLKADAKKKHTHSSTKIREFYYAIPINLLDSCLEYIPEHAGILTCERNMYDGIVVSQFRSPKINTKARKLDEKEILKASHLGCMRIMPLKIKIVALQDKILKQ